MSTHSFVHRFLALVTIAGLLLLILCVAASISAIGSHYPSVHAHGEVSKINRFRKRLNGNDEVSLNLNISMDLQSAFNWNTKQVFVSINAEYQTVHNSLNQVALWDHSIPDKGHAKLQAEVKNKYLLIDQGSHLLGKEIELVLQWSVVPKNGWLSEDRMHLSRFKLPDTYKL